MEQNEQFRLTVRSTGTEKRGFGLEGHNVMLLVDPGREASRSVTPLASGRFPYYDPSSLILRPRPWKADDRDAMASRRNSSAWPTSGS